MFTIPCVIFAGGKSSRMKRDKALLNFNNKPLAKYQYDRLKIFFKKVYISTKEDKFNFKADFIYDNSEIFAPAVAIKRVLEEIGTFFAISVDTPFIDEDIVKKILSSNLDADVIIAKTSTLHPLIGVYKKEFLPLLKKEIEQKNFKLQSILQKANTLYVEFEDEEKFLNCNYPDEFKEALKKIC